MQIDQKMKRLFLKKKSGSQWNLRILFDDAFEQRHKFFNVFFGCVE